MSDNSVFGRSLRQLPANQQAEQALLGAILANNRAYEMVADFLRPEHFYDPINGRIYAECVRLITAQRLADAVTLRGVLENTGILEEVGGTAYLARLLSAMVGIINAGEYGQAIHETAIRRTLIEVAEEACNAAYVGADAASIIAGHAAMQLDRVVHGEALGRRLVTLNEAMDSVMARFSEAPSPFGWNSDQVSTGFANIDDRLGGGMEPGQIYDIAGRPGMGKSALAFGIALNAARAGVGVLALSLEMSAQQLARRALSVASGVPMPAMRRANGHGVHPDFADRLVRARRELHDLPLHIDDASGQTPAMIRATVRAVRRKHGVGLILIDHLNLMSPDPDDAKHGGTWAISRASNTTLTIAKESECPVLLCVQLSRGTEAREDKRPMLSDLRQSGEIEQDAHAVGFVYRPEYYLPQSPPEQRDGEAADKYEQRVAAYHQRVEGTKGKAELIWAKVRDGAPGTDRLRFDATTASFSEPEGEGGR